MYYVILIVIVTWMEKSESIVLDVRVMLDMLLLLFIPHIPTLTLRKI